MAPKALSAWSISCSPLSRRDVVNGNRYGILELTLDGHGVFVDRERMAILRGEKRSEQTRVKQPDSLLNFDMVIYSGDHKRQGERGRGGEDVRETKDASSSFSSSSPSHCQKATTVQGQDAKRARERATANNNNKIDSFVVRGYLSIPPVFETNPSNPRPFCLGDYFSCKESC